MGNELNIPDEPLPETPSPTLPNYFKREPGYEDDLFSEWHLCLNEKLPGVQACRVAVEYYEPGQFKPCALIVPSENRAKMIMDSYLDLVNEKMPDGYAVKFLIWETLGDNLGGFIDVVEEEIYTNRT